MDSGSARRPAGQQITSPPGLPGRSYTQYNGFAMPVTYMDGTCLTATNYGNNYQPSKMYRAPFPQAENPIRPAPHTSRRSSSIEYVHSNSVFTSTMPKITGNYVIHPDWISERSTVRRSKSLLKL
ncbi:unnamed protein product [Lymnaea stagnalis]|uniref:Uncharacterized protein n=1 Tax=Lymnaea stagnalis TaxID=6523 RepID=A0AAV2H6I6_LYMST